MPPTDIYQSPCRKCPRPKPDEDGSCMKRKGCRKLEAYQECACSRVIVGAASDPEDVSGYQIVGV